MSEKKAPYHCRRCGHDFDEIPSSGEKVSQCPRCESTDLEKSPYLFGTSECSDLTPDDYFETCLAPCCTPNWLGWKHHFYGVDNWDYVLPPQQKDGDSTKKNERPASASKEPDK